MQNGKLRRCEVATLVWLEQIGVIGVWGLWPFLAVAGLASALYLVGFCWRPASLMKSAVKTAAVAPLAAAALLTPAGVPLALALGLCTLGDLLLSRDSETAFLSGVGAFAVGHVAYIALFLTHPAADVGRISPGVALALILFGMAMMVALFFRAGPLRWTVVAYVPIIVFMGFAALSLPQTGALVLVVPAAFAFMLSDTVLAAELFFLSAGHPVRRITPFVVWGTYWIAQFGFLLSVGWGL